MSVRFVLILSLLTACGDDDAAVVSIDAGPSPDSSTPALCGPTADGPYWLEEGETVEFDVRCATGASATFSAAELPEGASFTGGHFAWTPTLSQAAVIQWKVSAAIDGTSETGTIKIGVADAFDAPGNVPVVDPVQYPEEMGLPVIFVSVRPAEKVYEPATIVYRGHTYTAEAKLRGESSLLYPKNSYTLKFSKEDKFDEPGKDFRAKRKIVITSTFDDNSYVRQRMVYDLWNSLGRIQVQTYAAVVYLEGEYVGLYLLGDHVDGYLMEDHGLRQEGNLYKGVSHSSNLRTTRNNGAAKEVLHEGYEKKEGEPIGDFSDLHELLTWIDTASAEDFRTGIDARVDRADFEAWWQLVTFVLSDDSAGKNSYLYHDPLDAQGRWRFVTWDHNAALGQDWLTERESHDWDEDYTYQNGLFERLLAEPSFATPLRAAYQERRAGAWSKPAILAMVDAYVAEIDAGARRDWRKWAEAYRGFSEWSFRTNFTDFDGEVAYLRTWLQDRWDFVEANY